MKKYEFLFAIIVIMMTMAIISADVPQIISYQGKLTDSKSGVAMNGAYDITFRMYSSEDDISALWSETHRDVPVKNGLFSVMLGTISPFAPALDFSQQYYLEVAVDGNVLTPRFRLGASPYALNVPDRLVFADIRDETGESQFTVTNGDPGLRIVGSGAVDVNFDSESHTITVDVPVMRARPGGPPFPRGRGTPDYVAKWIFEDSLGNSQIYDNGENVGIGTISPENKLDIVGNCRADTFFGVFDGAMVTDTTDSCVPWLLSGNVIYTANALGCCQGCTTAFYGIAKGNAGNRLYGSKDSTHVNLGVESSTGSPSPIVLPLSYCTVGGGHLNSAEGDGATVSGGINNYAHHSYATVGGGASNAAESLYTTVGGGGLNTAHGHAATVSGGYHNNAILNCATVGGGLANYVQGFSSTIAGGEENDVRAEHSVIGGGLD
ncbi:hypothetical protein DRQ33_04860, partial [bacterium]